MSGSRQSPSHPRHSTGHELEWCEDRPPSKAQPCGATIRQFEHSEATSKCRACSPDPQPKVAEYSVDKRHGERPEARLFSNWKPHFAIIHRIRMSYIFADSNPRDRYITHFRGLKSARSISYIIHFRGLNVRAIDRSLRRDTNRDGGG